MDAKVTAVSPRRSEYRGAARHILPLVANLQWMVLGRPLDQGAYFGAIAWMTAIAEFPKVDANPPHVGVTFNYDPAFTELPLVEGADRHALDYPSGRPLPTTARSSGNPHIVDLLFDRGQSQVLSTGLITLSCAKRNTTRRWWGAFAGFRGGPRCLKLGWRNSVPTGNRL